MNKPACLRYSEISIGSVYSFEKKINQKDVAIFAELTGDYNPLHVDSEFGSRSIFKRNIVQGMLTGSLFSTLVGMYCPGENCLYLSQTLQFKQPVFPDDRVVVRGTVTSKNDSINLITIKTEIYKDENIVVAGEAKIKVLNA